MQFRLTYEGKLLSNGNATHKHEIRKAFHPQLKRLWEITPSLSEMTYPALKLVDIKRTHFLRRTEHLAEQFARNNYNFVPLVTGDLNVSYCGLNILYLRRDPPGSVVNRYGDIDNRIKTLFDALQIPPGKNDLGGYDMPDESERPFYVLLEDDRLITHVSVETDTLLEPVNGAFDMNDARLVVTVKIEPMVARLDLRFEGVNFT